MQDIRLALVGFGNVAQGLVQILAERGEQYARDYGLRFLITAIADPVKGSALDPHGLDLTRLLEAAQTAEGLHKLPVEQPNWDALGMIAQAPADVLVELSFTNLETGEPAASYLTAALQRKMHVVTTNKGPIALHYDRLSELARQNGVQIGVEGTVMSGTPTLRLGREILAAAGIRRVQGILNGTTNFILSKMESGQPYSAVLEEAQALGYAEADPTGDVEGYDAAAKVAILARLVMGVPLAFSEIERKGITNLTPADIQRAQSANQLWKLIGTLERDGDRVRGSVRPECLPDSHPLARISGATNAILFSTDLLGDVTLTGPGAGRLQTGFAVLQDLLAIYRGA